MRLIYADALKEYVLRIGNHWYSDWDTLGICNAVDAQPTIDAEPVAHGRWVNAQEDEYDDCEWRCSVCGDWQFFMPSPKYYGYNYCPKCGAKMDEEEE